MDSGVDQLERSSEADSKGLELGREQGKALDRTLEHMIREVAQHGDEKRVGDYLIAYAIEKAEGLWRPSGDRLEFSEPEDENAHVEIAVRDAADGRFIPGLTVRVSLTDPDGNEVGTHVQPLLWHPYLYHYGRNWKLPRSGKYRMRVEVDRPDFPRHDRKNGNRFAEGAIAEFDAVEIKTGQE